MDILKYFPKTMALIEEQKESYKSKIIRAVREKYSIDDELAILRQRDSKPEEFKEYFDFVENVKQSLKDQQ